MRVISGILVPPADQSTRIVLSMRISVLTVRDEQLHQVKRNGIHDNSGSNSKPCFDWLTLWLLRSVQIFLSRPDFLQGARHSEQAFVHEDL